MSFLQKVCIVDGLQFVSLKKFALSTAYNWLSLKSKRYRRLTIGFTRKVRAVYDLQFAFLEKFALSTAYNSLSSKSKDCRRLTIDFP